MQLIGIQILKGTTSQVRKVLDFGWYPFIRCKEDIGVTDKWPIVDDSILPRDFFNLHDTSNDIKEIPYVSISAIVGKNGTGKTTLINILYMLINNFAYAVLSSKRRKALVFKEEICAKLFFEKDNRTYCIASLGAVEATTLYVDNQQIYLTELTAEEQKTILEDFFYTISINYSLYAHNSEDDIPINRLTVSADKANKPYNWVDRLFDKNDGYQIPIVLTPYRQNGQINAYKENRLSIRRIIVLSILLKSRGGTLLDKYIPTNVLYHLDESYEKNKLEELRDIFEEKDSWINMYIEVIIKSFKDAWQNLLEKENIHKQIEFENLYKTALFYLSAKTLKLYYYKKILFDRSRRLFYLQDGALYVSKPDIEAFVKVTYSRRKDHLTRKIHQCISFLKQTLVNDKYDSFAPLSLFVPDKDISYETIDMLLPPPFYMLDLVLKTMEDEDSQSDDITIRRLSSGEKQLLYSMSYVAYHMNNLASIYNDTKINQFKRIKYRDVLLIFDEAELYYHPDFQREFIYELLRSIYLCNFNGSEINFSSLNVLLVTHSPYMLSDIPACNILRLGEHKKKNTETFGANIYDLLNDQFFMDSFVGEFAKQKIETIIQKVSKAKKKNVNDLQEEINLIGDEWVRNTLSIQLNKRLKKENIDA